MVVGFEAEPRKADRPSRLGTGRAISDLDAEDAGLGDVHPVALGRDHAVVFVWRRRAHVVIDRTEVDYAALLDASDEPEHARTVARGWHA